MMPVQARLSVMEVGKRYNATVALASCSFDVMPGEVVALVGHNGAGKSTVSKIISGYERPDGGQISLDGTVIDLRSPRDAASSGIGLVPQHLAIVNEMTVAQNLTLGLRGNPTQYASVTKRLGLDRILGMRSDGLGPAGQRLVMIGRSLIRSPKLLILDEPTAAFSIKETEALFQIIRELTADGISIIYISHRLEEVLEVADRVVGMSQGRVIADRPTAGLTSDDLADIIAGGHDALAAAADDELTFVADEVEVEAGREVLSLREVRTASKKGAATLTVRAGEVVGLTGLVGAGRSSLLRALWGAGEPILDGSVEVMGKAFAAKTPRRAMQSGMVLVPEDRQRTSVVPGMTVRENVTLATSRSRRYRWTPFVNRRREHEEVDALLRSLDMKPEGAAEMSIGALSGGNQQKAVLARWLMVPADLVMLDEPCEGVDVRARREIHTVLRALADQGKAVLVSSSDVEELVEAADRILVMKDGQIVGEISGPQMTVERVNRACL